MPWIALHDGEKKGAWQVPKRTDAECPDCGSRMRVWAEASDGTARHFKHVDEMGGGNGGPGSDCESVAESDEHLKWKNWAAERLAKEFNENIAECRVEKRLDAPASEKSRRLGDAVLTFDEPDPQLGMGIVVEVQHKNVSKDIEGTTEDYLEQGYAVVWTSQEDFSAEHCRLGEIDFRNRARETAWPTYVPTETDWPTPEAHYRIQRERRIAKRESEEIIAGTPATIPRDWYDAKALEIWRSQSWGDLFQRTHGFLAAVQSRAGWSKTVEFPFFKWLFELDSAEGYWSVLRQAHNRGQAKRENRLVETCPSCGEVETHDPIHSGEMLRSTTCGCCGEWYVVSDER